jgi:hypothetical protein
VNVDTGSFRALSDQAARVDEYHRREALLFRAMEMLLDGRPDLQPQAGPARPQLRVIQGGKR